MIRLLKKKAKAILHYRPVSGDGHFKRFHYLFTSFDVCLTPQAAHAVMSTHHKSFEKGFIMRELLDPVIGSSLFTTDGTAWKAKRSLYNQWFKKDVYESALASCQEMLDGEIPALVSETETNFAQWARCLMTRLFCEKFLGVSYDSLGAINQYHIKDSWIFITIIARLLKIYGFKRIYYAGHVASIQMTAKKLLEKKYDHQNGYVQFLQNEIEKGNIHEQEAISEIASNYSSAVTTSYSLCMLATHLANHPCLFKRKNWSDEEIKSVCLESTRLTPTTYVLFRQATEDTMICDHVIKKNRHIVIPVETLQRNELFWDKAMEFCPARFVGMDKTDLKNKAYFSFGSGQRQCPGRDFALEIMAIFLKTIIREKIRFSSDDKRPPKFDRGLILEPENNEMWIKVSQEMKAL